MVDRKVTLINSDELLSALGAEASTLLKRNYDLQTNAPAEVSGKDIVLFFLKSEKRDLPLLGNV